jgi:predicted small secreted protein
MRATIIGLVLASSLTIAACDTEDDGSDVGSGVPGNKPLTDLTAEDVRTLCDWASGLYGGYGKETPCKNGTTTFRTEASAEACVSENVVSPSCTATVAEFEACGRALHDACTKGTGDAGICLQIVECYTVQ